MTKEFLGAARELKSGRWQARYTYKGISCKAPHTFPRRAMAEAWLVDETDLVNADKRGRATWVPPHVRQERERGASMTLSQWFETDYMQRVDIRQQTKRQQESLFKSTIKPYLGETALRDLTPTQIPAWNAMLRELKGQDRAACGYKLLTQLLNRAVRAGHLEVNPCQHPELGRRPKSKEVPLLEPEQLAVVLREVGEAYRLPVMVAASCAMRVGEWTELRVKDVEVTRHASGVPAAARIFVTRGVSADKGGVWVGDPKTQEGRRVIHVPAWLVPELVAHIDGLGRDPETLLFVRPKSGKQVTRQALNKVLTRAGKIAGYRGNLTTHKLRHFGATEFLEAGGTVRDLQARLGHSTPTQALHYAHASARRDRDAANNIPAMMPAPEETKETEEGK